MQITGLCSETFAIINIDAIEKKIRFTLIALISDYQDIFEIFGATQIKYNILFYRIT